MDRQYLLTDPNQFLSEFKFETGRALFVGIARDQYRIKMSRPRSYSMELLFSLLASEYAANLRSKLLPASHYIFMIDYCGSTLLADALGCLDGIFFCGERFVLAQLGEERYRQHPSAASRVMSALQVDWDQLQALVMRYQAKTASQAQAALFKEWGAANFIIPEQLKADPRSRAIFMYSTLEEYLTASLKDPRRRYLARWRIEESFTGLDLIEPLRGIRRHGLPDHEACALHWLTLMYRYMTAGYSSLSGLLALRSDAFFKQPLETIARVAAHFGIPTSNGELERIVAGPVFCTYSKDKTRAFFMADRETANMDARTRYQEEIEAGLRFAHRIMARNPIPDCLPTDLFSFDLETSMNSLV
jgi:hypothetical protein